MVDKERQERGQQAKLESPRKPPGQKRDRRDIRERRDWS
jgi:hypothetical protein